MIIIFKFEFVFVVVVVLQVNDSPVTYKEPQLEWVKYTVIVNDYIDTYLNTSA